METGVTGFPFKGNTPLFYQRNMGDFAVLNIYTKRSYKWVLGVSWTIQVIYEINFLLLGLYNIFKDIISKVTHVYFVTYFWCS